MGSHHSDNSAMCLPREIIVAVVKHFRGEQTHLGRASFYCASQVLHVLKTEGKALSAKRLRLAFLQWSGAQPAIPPRYACTPEGAIR